eukprot:scaffold2780_cov174-Amphora_coffeaeformis.AAC.6
MLSGEKAIVLRRDQKLQQNTMPTTHPAQIATPTTIIDIRKNIARPSSFFSSEDRVDHNTHYRHC